LLCEIDIRKEFFKDDCDNEIQEKPYNAVNKLKEFYQNDSSKIKILTTEMNKVFEYNFGSNYLFKVAYLNFFIRRKTDSLFNSAFTYPSSTSMGRNQLLKLVLKKFPEF
jgi:hypothetical protein